MLRSFRPLSWILAALLLASASFAGDENQNDTVFLANGKTRTGRVIYEDAQTLILRRGTKDTEIPQAEIQDVDAIWRNLPDLLERLEALGPLDEAPTNEIMELARFAEQSRLPGEAEILRFAALLQDPSNDAVFESLELRSRKRGAQFKHSDHWRSRDALNETSEKWDERWTLSSTHYVVESDLVLSRVIAAVLDAERFYQDFYVLLGAPARLMETDEPLEVALYGESAAFPEPGDGRRGFFDDIDFGVDVDMRGQGGEQRMVHELTRQLIFETSLNSERARGAIPRWFQEGLAVAMSNGRSGAPGLAKHDPSALDADAIREHASAGDDTYELKQLLVFAYVDFEAKQRQSLKYAQAYTFFHTLMYTDNGRYADRLMAFLASAYAGSGSPTDLQKTLDLDIDELEELWAQHLAKLLRQI